jgi:hypothetical protein
VIWIDDKSKKGCWADVRGRAIALAVATVMTFGGLVAAASGSQAEPLRSFETAVSGGALTPTGRAGARICDPEYPYPGCSMSQIASLEAGTKQKAKRSYKKARWGQKRDDFKNVGSRANRILKRAWRNARAKWIARHPDQRPIYGSWRAFRANLGDGGCTSLGWMASINFWCHFDREFNEKIVDNSARVVNGATMACGGGALLFTVSGQARKIARKAKMVALTWREAVAEAAIGCVSGLYARYFTDLY